MANGISGKVLIVDDSAGDRKLINDLLKDDYQVTEAQDGATALDMIAKELPDLVLLDIQMPGVDGFEICHRLKKDLVSSSLPIIFLTASTDIENRLKAFVFGAADYIIKPVIPDEVKARVRAHIMVKKPENDAGLKLENISAQLIQIEKMAAIGEITAGVAHELNQPLNVIKIICQSIMKDIEKERFSLESAKQDLPEVINQMNRMAQIVDHMRAFSKRKVGITIEELNINDSIDAVFVFLGQQLTNHNVLVDKQYASNLPKIKGDSIRLQQVFMNLITNARQALMACEKKPMKIEIKTFVSGDGKSVVAQFKDNGPGIPPEIREKIFEAFFTTKGVGEGTGLGLSTARKIIEEHGGKIEVESVLGDWTNFRVILPLMV